MLKRLSLVAAGLALCIVMLGAYVRLNDAGLGCPDWPGCYGHIGVPDVAADVAAAYPDKPLEPVKAWLEMIHRYFATALGFLILVICGLAWKNRVPGSIPRLPTALVAVVILQGMLGMWTVTLLLKPVIVSLHLLGGLTTFALLSVMALSQMSWVSRGAPVRPWVRTYALVALILLACQLGLGAWTSTNYAALACGDFPTCQGQWMPPHLDFEHGFHLERALGRTADGGLLSLNALAAIHWVHRLGALTVALVLAGLGMVLWRAPGLKRLGGSVFLALAVQITVGILLVHWQLPMALAVMHNGGAALLLLVLVTAVTVTQKRAHRLP